MNRILELQNVEESSENSLGTIVITAVCSGITESPEIIAI